MYNYGYDNIVKLCANFVLLCVIIKLLLHKGSLRIHKVSQRILRHFHLLMTGSEIPDPGYVEANEDIIKAFKEFIFILHHVVLGNQVPSGTGENLEDMCGCSDFIADAEIVLRRIGELVPLADAFNLQRHIAVYYDSRLGAELHPSYEMQGNFIMIVQ